MRSVKAILFAALVFGLFSLWSNRDYVIDAYREPAESQQVTLSGVDLAVTRSRLGQSPFVIPAAPDTRVEPPPALAFAPSADQYPVVPLAGGDVNLSGVVTGPDGPVEGASVEIQRHTADGVAQRTVSTDENGAWEATGLVGGRYRVRAWLSGVLAMGASEVAFLTEDDSRQYEFELWGIDPSPELELVTNEALYLNIPTTMAVVYTRPVIDDRGVVVATPVPAQPIVVSASQAVTIFSDSTDITGVDGVARFAIVCTQLSGEGAFNTGVVIARAGELVQTFPMPPCVLPPEPEEPEGEDSESAGGAGTNSSSGDADG